MTIMVMVRRGGPDDAPSLARMISDFNEEEGSPGRVNAADVVEICFDLGSIYQAIVAEDGDDLIGYALIMRYFDTEPCAWCSYMQDLFVVSARRSQGVGRHLIAAVAKAALDQEHAILYWHVRDRNKRGRAFYASVGGKEQTPLAVTLEGEALAALAGEA
jgi:GNAT superfamily N-acetyltransferase